MAAIEEAARSCVAAQFGLAVREVVVSPPASLPRTSSGKPQRSKTRQMYLDGTLPRARYVQVVPATGPTGAVASGDAAGDGPMGDRPT